MDDLQKWRDRFHKVLAELKAVENQCHDKFDPDTGLSRSDQQTLANLIDDLGLHSRALVRRYSSSFTDQTQADFLYSTHALVSKTRDLYDPVMNDIEALQEYKFLLEKAHSTTIALIEQADSSDPD